MSWTDIPADMLEQIYRQAREAFPSECCGYIYPPGPDGEPPELVPCKNRQDALHALDPEAHPRTSANAYNIGGKELLTLVRSFESERPVAIIYHSHPEVGAYFSEEDTRAALAAGYPVDYLVVDCQAPGGGVPEALLFRRNADAYEQVARYDGRDDI